MKPPYERPLARTAHKHISKTEETNLKPNFSFFMSLSKAEAHVCGVKFIVPYATVGFTAIRDFLRRERFVE